MHSSQRLWEVSESRPLPDGEKSTFKSADDLGFNECTNTDMIDDILLCAMYDFAGNYTTRSVENTVENNVEIWQYFRQFYGFFNTV